MIGIETNGIEGERTDSDVNVSLAEHLNGGLGDWREVSVRRKASPNAGSESAEQMMGE